jgi:hypothetical protein
MGYQPYYDEEGKFHRHDPNWHSSSFRCSRGHEWTRSWKAGCGACDYGKGGGRMSKEKELRELLQMGLEVVEDFMPNIGHCVLQDYGRVNEFLMRSKEELKNEFQTDDRSTRQQASKYPSPTDGPQGDRRK